MNGYSAAEIRQIYLPYIRSGIYYVFPCRTFFLINAAGIDDIRANWAAHHGLLT